MRLFSLAVLVFLAYVGAAQPAQPPAPTVQEQLTEINKKVAELTEKVNRCPCSNPPAVTVAVPATTVVLAGPKQKVWRNVAGYGYLACDPDIASGEVAMVTHADGSKRPMRIVYEDQPMAGFVQQVPYPSYPNRIMATPGLFGFGGGLGLFGTGGGPNACPGGNCGSAGFLGGRFR